MSLRFHWFLPTNGDGRDIVGGGHGVATGAAGAIRPPSVEVPGPDRPQRRAARLRGRAHPDRHLVRGRLAGDRHADRGDRAAEVPGRVPPRPDQPHAVGADGATFQRLSSGRLLLNVVTGGERPSSAPTATSSTRTSGTSAPASSSTSSPGSGRARPSPRRQAPQRRGRTAVQAPDPVPDIYFGGSSTGRGPGRREVLRRLPDLGRAAERGQRQAPLDRRTGRRAGPRRSASASGCTRSPGTPPRRPGAQAGYDRAGHRRHDRQGPGGPREQRVGGPEADARAAPQRRPPRPARPRDPPEPVGRRRPGPRRRRHLPGRQPRGGRQPASRSTPTPASPSSSSPATRTWRRHTGSARACCRSSSAAASGVIPPRPGKRRRPSSRSRRCTPPPAQPATDRIAAS